MAGIPAGAPRPKAIPAGALPAGAPGVSEWQNLTREGLRWPKGNRETADRNDLRPTGMVADP